MSSYPARFYKVIEYIEDNLPDELDIETLCQLANLSRYHFHRQCSAFFGLPVMSLVKLLKLKRAAFQLAYREHKIIDIALSNGYASHEGFSRAFRKHFGLNPAEFRKSPDWTLWQSQYDPLLKLRKKLMQDRSDFNVEIVDFPEIPVAVAEHRGDPGQLGKTIAKFIQWRKENKLPPTKSRTFNLVYDDPQTTPPQDYRFDLCCAITSPITDNAHGIGNSVIPAGKCAVIRHIGSDDAISEVVNYLYTQWLSDSDYEIRDYPLFFERVSFFPEVQESEMITDVYLPLR
ncbi:AraC family transcriptional regulator [Lacimicrobium alkaliphilum]|uniref:AraC family transcriptional regulator n=1 Tax=Lacimicrobium alkaliphilum TaxID=1526571 RepID=A0ABQ1RET8_9ALTE|nr:AraC family transcriptional regulator [Lacimicrobium alkaliphilum]GGD68164.1 AraC family transcriptional regulator [Lacimicrobium alkaliphilum]